jgi:hypothetical protein
MEEALACVAVSGSDYLHQATSRAVGSAQRDGPDLREIERRVFNAHEGTPDAQMPYEPVS